VITSEAVKFIKHSNFKGGALCLWGDMGGVR